MVIALNERARPTQPTSAQIDQLITLYKANRYLEMENQARTISHLYPNSGLAFKTLGIALHLQGKDSLSAWQMAAELMPDDIETHFNLGVAMKDLVDLTKLWQVIVRFWRSIQLMLKRIQILAPSYDSSVNSRMQQYASAEQ